jgi:hypothetical protein
MSLPAIESGDHHGFLLITQRISIIATELTEFYE